MQAVPALPPPLQLRADTSYLLVGGLGGIGIEIAKWMVNKLGAKSLILILRSNINTIEITNAIAALETLEVFVIIRKYNVLNK